MKKLLILTAFVSSLATATFADDFGNAEFDVSATVNALTFGLTHTEDDGLDSLYAEYATLDHSIGIGNSHVTFGAEYFVDTEQTALSVAHNTFVSFDKLTVKVAPEVEYLSAADTLKDGDFYFTPTIGVSYNVNPTVSLFTDVQYSWNTSEDWAETGGEFRVGADFAVATNIAVTPYITHTFDVVGVEDVTEAGVALNLAF